MDGTCVGKERRIRHELEFVFDLRIGSHTLLDSGGFSCFLDCANDIKIVDIFLKMGYNDTVEKRCDDFFDANKKR